MRRAHNGNVYRRAYTPYTAARAIAHLFVHALRAPVGAGNQRSRGYRIFSRSFLSLETLRACARSADQFAMIFLWLEPLILYKSFPGLV